MLITQTDIIFSGNLGSLNFYVLSKEEKIIGNIDHVNVGVGICNNPIPFEVIYPQVIDATEGSTLNQRNGCDGQYITPKTGQVNQTYAPFSTNSFSYIQGEINWDILDEKYR